MGTANAAPASGASPTPGQPAGRDWIDVTVRLATSWAGGFTAYFVALILLVAKLKELTEALHGVGIHPRLGVAVIVALPLVAIVFSTIPAFIDQRRVKRYSEIAGAIQMGYFTLRPRENEAGFERADNAHQEILHWMETTTEPVLYLTGASGTGKSSLLSAYVIPRLKRERHVVIQLRGYQDDLLACIKDKLLDPGVIWDTAPANADDLLSLLRGAIERVDQSRLFIVIDQFEEFLILADREKQKTFQQFLSKSSIDGLTFLLVYRPEYEGLIQDQPWPELQLDTNRKVLSPFTESAAQEFMRKSGLTLNPDLLRAVLREAAENDQTVGLIRPVTINLCGLVLSRFSSGLPRRFRGGIIRGFLRESLSLPEVRAIADKLIPQLITDNVTKRPRTIAELSQTTALAPSAVRACLRRLGESDRAIVRPLDQHQETWEISHDFLVPLLDSIVARGTVSLWRRFRPWLPWSATAVMGIGAIAIPLLTSQNARAALVRQGWTVREYQGALSLNRDDAIPAASITVLRGLRDPFSIFINSASVADVLALREVKTLTSLNLIGASVTDVSALRDLKNLTHLILNFTDVDVSTLRELRSLTYLVLNGQNVTGISALRELTNLTQLNLNRTQVTDVSALRTLTNLTQLDLSYTQVTDVSPLSELRNLTQLDLTRSPVTDVSPLRTLTNLTQLHLERTPVTDVNLMQLNLRGTKVTDVSALSELKNLTQLDLTNTPVTDVSSLSELKNLKILQ